MGTMGFGFKALEVGNRCWAGVCCGEQCDGWALKDRRQGFPRVKRGTAGVQQDLSSLGVECGLPRYYREERATGELSPEMLEYLDMGMDT